MNNINDSILIIKKNDNSFERFYSKKIIDHGVDVLDIREIRGYREVNNFLEKQMLIGLHFVHVRKWKSYLRKYKIIILFGSPSFIPWLYYFKSRYSRLILWMWNSETKLSARNLKFISGMCEIWTFDETDAQKYGWKLNTQFYFKTTKENKKLVEKRKSAFFVGLDKNRYHTLKQLKGILEKHEIEADFWMLKEAGKKYNSDDLKWIKDEEMPYEQVLEHVLSDDIIIDIVKDGQTGFTVRIMEALFYGKKVLTNNMAVLVTEFYDKNNFFVIGYDDWNDLGKFLMYDNKKILDYHNIKKYDFSEWLLRFI